MSDIAERVGVSRATVSYVLNDREVGLSIRPETRQRILEVASEMGYRRNDLARAVVTGKNYVLGYLTHTPGAEVSSRIMVGAQDVADGSGYVFKQLPFRHHVDYTVPVRRCIEQRLAGLLVLSFNEIALAHLHEEAARFNIPIVLMDDSPRQPWAPLVNSDSELGMQQGLDHLIALGHRRIAFVSAQNDTPLAVTRADSFRRVAQARGLDIPPEHVIYTNWDNPPVIEAGVRTLLQQTNRPTALFCAGDKIAIVAQRTARALGLQLPRDLSIMGFADLVMAEFADPPLTTVAQAFEEVGCVAARRLLDMIQNPAAYAEEPQPALTVPTNLVVRASTCPPAS